MGKMEKHTPTHKHTCKPCSTVHSIVGADERGRKVGKKENTTPKTSKYSNLLFIFPSFCSSALLCSALLSRSAEITAHILCLPWSKSRLLPPAHFCVCSPQWDKQCQPGLGGRYWWAYCWCCFLPVPIMLVTYLGDRDARESINTSGWIGLVHILPINARRSHFYASLLSHSWMKGLFTFIAGEESELWEKRVLGNLELVLKRINTVPSPPPWRLPGTTSDCLLPGALPG